MKQKILSTVITATILSTPFFAFSESSHKHKEEESENHEEHDEHKDGDDHKDHKGHEDHGKEEEHGSEKGHGHEEEEGSSSVGPEKGILEASDNDGIKLSPEALKNFEIKTQKISGTGPWTIPNSARLHSKEETNLYRLRNGFFKRIDFMQSKKDEKQFIANSKDLKNGDEVVVHGVGFLRIAEVTAFGGAPEGHSH